jgi:hypothetical protein
MCTLFLFFSLRFLSVIFFITIFTVIMSYTLIGPLDAFPKDLISYTHPSS